MTVATGPHGRTTEQSAAYIEKNGITVDNSKMPVNTNGGLMSEGDQTGYGPLVEMVRQLRGEAGGRQVPDAQIVQWASPWSDSMILRTP
jgi:acetyl-CoA acetyltransferase